VVTNIGIHFFDMLSWIFGDVVSNSLHLLNPEKASGLLQLKNANVRWYLSIDKQDLPEHAIQNNQPTYRSITVDGEEIEFSGGFTDLHTESYRNILLDNGYGISEARNSIEIAHLIRNQKITSNPDVQHPFL
jgi:UDP-N-acetyl-2-amino-2-deoxyglucuronate dehydrogenase